jgi:sugar O-acyltransferase (sialic acid O-acetyltransferase NeuD family)
MNGSALVIWGAGGHGKVVAEAAAATHKFSSIVFVDDNPARAGTLVASIMVLGTPGQQLAALLASGYCFAIAIGDNRIRARAFARALELGGTEATVVHPSAIVSPSAKIGAGTVIMPRVVVNAGATVDADSILNTGSIVEHDCRIGAHVHISPGAVLGGGVVVGEGAHLGLGAIALPGAVIGAGAIVGAGGVVLREAPAYSVMAGVPARPLQVAAGTVRPLEIREVAHEQ